MLSHLTKTIAISAALTTTAPALAMAQETAARDGGFAYVGSRTSKERNARGNGIETFRVDADGTWAHSQTIGDLVNPSFLITNSDGSLLFTTHGDLEEASSFQVDQQTGALEKLSTASVEGANPVHLALDGEEHYLIVANYKTGSVVSLPVNEDGSLGTVVSKIDLPGEPGPHRDEQTSSHPHQVLVDASGQTLIVPDKGLDRIFVLSIDEAGTLSIVSEVVAREGAGPRHGDFGAGGNTLYVINELDSTIAGYRYEEGALLPFQVVSTLPDEFPGNSRAAAIDVSKDGRFVYGTNRGHDSIVRFAVDAATGRLSEPQWTSSQGERPRFMTISPSGDELLVANELTDSVISFDIGQNGQLLDGNEVAKTGSPVSIIFGMPPN